MYCLYRDRLRVFENRVLRRIFGLKRDEVTGGWRKVHNEELHNSHSSPNVIRMITSKRMTWKIHVEERNAYRILVGKPEGKIPLRRPRYKWKVNVEMDLREIGMDWINLARDRDLWRAFVNMIMKLRVS
jgi:hypothetical protein